MNQCVLRFMGGRPAASALMWTGAAPAGAGDAVGGGAAAAAGALWKRQRAASFQSSGRYADRIQGVGQNRHLKAALVQGHRANGGHILFRHPPAVPLPGGERVDVAFYLQVNEFRGSRTVQLQVVDLRPSLQSSAREEGIPGASAAAGGGVGLTSREALRILPSRQQCAAVGACCSRMSRMRKRSGSTCRFCGTFPLPFRGRIRSCGPASAWSYSVSAAFGRRSGDGEIRSGVCAVDGKVDLEQSP